MPIRPVEDAGKDGIPPFRAGSLQALLEYLGVFPVELAQGNSLADVEGSPTAVLDQIGGRGHAEEDESQLLISGIGCASVVDKPDSGEKVVGKVEVQRGVYLVHKDDHRSRHFRQHHVMQKVGETLHRAQGGSLRPPGFRVHGEL